MIAISRIMLPNVKHIQASWLTVENKRHKCVCIPVQIHGSIMIEENVVSAAGAPFRFTSTGIQQAIRDAGYIPQLRDQQYRERNCLLILNNRY
jgi:cyclic dehypoxanthinyl futalosine synthase